MLRHYLLALIGVACLVASGGEVSKRVDFAPIHAVVEGVSHSVVAPAEALTNGQKAVLFGGIRPAFAEYFTRESGLPSANFSANFSYTGASLKMQVDPTGTWTFGQRPALLLTGWTLRRRPRSHPASY